MLTRVLSLKVFIQLQDIPVKRYLFLILCEVLLYSWVLEMIPILKLPMVKAPSDSQVMTYRPLSHAVEAPSVESSRMLLALNLVGQIPQLIVYNMSMILSYFVMMLETQLRNVKSDLGVTIVLNAQITKGMFMYNCRNRFRGNPSTFPCIKAAAPNILFSTTWKRFSAFHAFFVEKRVHKRALKDPN